MVLILYIVVFVVGPALFLLLARSDGRSWPLAAIASVLVALSFALRKNASLLVAVDTGPLLVSLFLIWVAWILVLVLVVRAVCRTYSGHGARRWAQALGAMGTTVPWFGFAAATMMAE